MAQGFVISDLHLGGGEGDPLEDFWLDDLFCGFVRSLAHPDTTLIINGDFVDFAQLEPLEVEGLPSHLLWNEAASVAKLETVLAGHPNCFKAIGDMLARGGQVRIVIGNHDLDFVWGRVQRRFCDAVGLTPDDPRLSFVVGAVNFHGVHIEHGYAFTPENSPKNPVEFVHEGPEGERYLERVWGTDFLLSFLNELEREHKYVDNVKPTITLAWHALRNRWIPVRALVRLAVTIKRIGIPWNTVPTLLDARQVSPATMLEVFGDPEWQQLALELTSDLTDEVQIAIDGLPALDRAVLAEGTSVLIGEPIEPVQAEVLGVFRNTTREERAAKNRLQGRNITHVVFGHTHDIIDNGLAGSWFNPGSWIPHLDLTAAYVQAKVREYGWSLDLVSDRSLYDTQARAVRITPRDGVRAEVALVNVNG